MFRPRFLYFIAFVFDSILPKDTETVSTSAKNNKSKRSIQAQNT
jgi:hypothetical protein